MKRSRISLFLLAFFFVVSIHPLCSQTLRVELSPDKSKVDRSTNSGTATIFFDSNIDDLKIVCTEENPEEPIQKMSKRMWFTHIDVNQDIEKFGVCYRNFLLKSKESSEYFLKTPDIESNQVLYYTIVLPEQYMTSLGVEYLFTGTSKNAVRVSFGKRFGGYLSYKWGDYYKAGADISQVMKDYEIASAKYLGNIRTAVTGGVSIGLYKLRNETFPLEMKLLVGAGYGEYGRQWVNETEVERNIYFYSDYIKGFDAELSFQWILFNWLMISAGAEMITGNDRITFDYQIGVGLNIPLSLLKPKKHNN